MKQAEKHFRGNATRLFRLIQEGVAEGADEVVERVASQTPVDSGSLRANWQVARKDSEVKEFVDGKRSYPNLVATLTQMLHVHRKHKIGFTINEFLIANPTPYAIHIERGLYKRETEKVVEMSNGFFSRQADRGVVKAFEAEDAKTLADAVKYLLRAF